MKIRFFLVIAIILFGTYSLSFGEVNKSSSRAIPVAAKPAAKAELYVTSWCPYCTQAMKFLDDNHVPYVAYDIEKDKQAAKRREKLSPRQGVPFAVINGKKIYGFSAEAYSQALGLK